MPLKYSLIGKFPSGRPALESIRKVFATLNLKSEFNIGLLDAKHVLIRMNNEVDYHRVWLKEQWNIYQYPMRVFKWTPCFSPAKECPVIPTWILFPGLPPHLFDRDALRSIARGVGKPLQVDGSTASLARPSVARVCVEIDMTKPLVKRIWIGCEDDGYWQQVQYESIPSYCKKCFKFGHEDKNCGNFETNHANENRAMNIKEPKSKEPADQRQRMNNNNTRIDQQQQWVLVTNKKNKNANIQHPSSSKENENKKNIEHNSKIQNGKQKMGGTSNDKGNKTQKGSQEIDNMNTDMENNTQQIDLDTEDKQRRDSTNEHQKQVQDICDSEEEDEGLNIQEENDVEKVQGNSVYGQAISDHDLIDRIDATGQDIIMRGSPRASSAANSKSHHWELESGYASEGKIVDIMDRQSFKDFSSSLMHHQMFRDNNDQTKEGDTQSEIRQEENIQVEDQANTKNASKRTKKQDNIPGPIRFTRSTSKNGSSQGISNNVSQ